MENINYYEVIPDSHYWDSLQSLLHYLDSAEHTSSDPELIKYLQIGLSNTLKNGYDLGKKN